MQKQTLKLVLVLLITSSNLANAQNSNNFFLGDITLRLGPEAPPTTFDYIPDSFPNLDLPPHFLFETASTLYGEQTLILNTQMSRADTFLQLVEIVEAAGFVDFHELAGRELTNFIVTERTRYSRSYCRDDAGYLTFRMEDLGLSTRVTLRSLGHEALGVFVSCEDEASQSRGFALNGQKIRQWMQDAAVLNLPDEARVTNPPRMVILPPLLTTKAILNLNSIFRSKRCTNY